MILVPQVVGLTLCDHVEVDRTAGQHSLIGIFHRKHFSVYPTPPQQFAVYAQLYDPYGRGTMELEISNEATEKTVFLFQKLWVVSQRMQWRHLEINVKNCVFPEPGLYECVLRWEGKTLSERSLELA